jgi:hypothetical protein
MVYLARDKDLVIQHQKVLFQGQERFVASLEKFTLSPIWTPPFGSKPRWVFSVAPLQSLNHGSNI